MYQLTRAVESVSKSLLLSSFPLVLWCLIVFLLSSLPGNAYPQVKMPNADKLVHFHLYFLGGLASALFFFRLKAAMLVPIIFGVMYGLSDEIHQLWVPLRTFSLADLGADALGIAAGVLTFHQYLHRLHFPYRHSRGEGTSFIHMRRMESV